MFQGTAMYIQWDGSRIDFIPPTRNLQSSYIPRYLAAIFHTVSDITFRGSVLSTQLERTQYQRSFLDSRSTNQKSPTLFSFMSNSDDLCYSNGSGDVLSTLRPLGLSLGDHLILTITSSLLFGKSLNICCGVQTSQWI